MDCTPYGASCGRVLKFTTAHANSAIHCSLLAPINLLSLTHQVRMSIGGQHFSASISPDLAKWDAVYTRSFVEWQIRLWKGLSELAWLEKQQSLYSNAFHQNCRDACSDLHPFRARESSQDVPKNCCSDVTQLHDKAVRGTPQVLEAGKLVLEGPRGIMLQSLAGCALKIRCAAPHPLCQGGICIDLLRL